MLSRSHVAGSATGVSLRLNSGVLSYITFSVALTSISQRTRHDRRNAPRARNDGDGTMSLGLILLIVVVLMLVGAIPTWPHSRGWGYGPSGGLGLVLIILLVLVLMGQI
jgi:hypothetical protein